MIRKKPTLQQLVQHGGVAIDSTGKWITNSHWILDVSAVTLTADAAVAQALAKQWAWKWRGGTKFRDNCAKMDLSEVIADLKGAMKCRAEMLPIIYDGEDVPQRVFATVAGISFFNESYVGYALGTANGDVEWRTHGLAGGALYMLQSEKLKAAIMPLRADNLPKWISDAFPPKPEPKD